VTVRTIRLDELPKAKRNRVSPIKRTRDWTETMDRIKSSDFDAVMVEFSSDTLKLGKSVPERFKRMLAVEIKALGLDSHVRLIFRGKSASGAPVLYIIRQQGIELPRPRNRRQHDKLQS
jgi:hypothetical protein